MGLCRSCKNFVKIIADVTYTFFIRCHCKLGILLHIYSCNINLMFGKEKLGCLTLSLGAKFGEVLRFDFAVHPLVRKLFLYLIKTVSHLESENLPWIYYAKSW